jgi:hypothetical protein
MKYLVSSDFDMQSTSGFAGLNSDLETALLGSLFCSQVDAISSE